MRLGKNHAMFADLFRIYGWDIQTVIDPNAPLGTLYIHDPNGDGQYVMRGSTYNINLAKKFRKEFGGKA